MGIPFVRPLVRSGILSDTYQKSMVKPQNFAPDYFDKLLAKAGKNPEKLEELGGLFGAGALIPYR
jgi:hypothetical protein